MLDKAEAVALLKLQLIEFQEQVAETVGTAPDEGLIDMRHDLKAQIAKIENIRRNLPPRPLKSFDRNHEKLLIEARERLLGK